MPILYRSMALVTFLLIVAGCAHACEPVVPFILTVAPALAFSGSLLMLGLAVLVKSALFTVFERRLPRFRAAWRMFVGNILTSFVGVLVAAMIGSGPAFLIGVPVVFLLCWLPARRLVKVAPLSWLTHVVPGMLAFIMTCALLASCILFGLGQEAITAHRFALYWTMKLVAISLALAASVTLTTVWEEWVIWRLSSRPEGKGFFTSVLRTNLYVLVLVMAVPAAIMLPKRLKNPHFLAHRSQQFVAHPVRTPGGIIRTDLQRQFQSIFGQH